MSHTPGPWTIDEEWVYPEEHPNWAAVRIGDQGMSVNGHIGIANARLIAAAPDLLHALKNLYALVQGECPSLLEDDHHDVMVSGAIAKAEGRS
jgi:hypothetical protein